MATLPASGDSLQPWRQTQGMHWRTFWRLKAEHDAFVGVSLAGMARRFGLIERGLAGVAELLKRAD